MPVITTTVTAETEVHFEVFCNRCEEGICNNADVRYSRSRGEPQITIDPCEGCIDEAVDEALERAKKVTEQDEWEQYIDSFHRSKNERRFCGVY